MTKNIYKELLEKLKKNYLSYQHFCNLKDDILLQEIKESLGDLEIKSHKEEIRKSISSFYQLCGFKAFLFFKADSSLILNKKVINLDSNIVVDRLTSELSEISKYLKDSQKKDNVKYLYKETTNNILKKICNDIDAETKKELIRSFLKISLNLNPRDAIFFINGTIMIKFFKENEATKRMFDTLSDESLKSVESIVLKDNFDKKLSDMVSRLLNEELNIQKIDNMQFAKNFIKILQEKFLEFIPSQVSNSDPLTLQGYANYIFRNSFDKTMVFIAKYIMEALGNKDRNYESFVRFYNGDVTFTPSGKRYQKSDIVDSTNQRWNSSTILQVVLNRKNALNKIRDVNESIKKTKESIDRVESDIVNTNKKIEQDRIDIVELEREFGEKIDAAKDSRERIHKLRSELQGVKNTQRKSEILEEINTTSIEIKSSSRDEERAIANKKRVELDIERGQIRLKTLAKDLETYKMKLKKHLEQRELLIEKLKPLDEKYDIVAQALAKAISSFRGA